PPLRPAAGGRAHARRRPQPGHRRGRAGRPGGGVAAVQRLAALDGYYLFHATRADLLERLGRHQEATAAYDEALQRTTNAAEQRLLRERRDALQGADGG